MENKSSTNHGYYLSPISIEEATILEDSDRFLEIITLYKDEDDNCIKAFRGRSSHIEESTSHAIFQDVSRMYKRHKKPKTNWEEDLWIICKANKVVESGQIKGERTISDIIDEQYEKHRKNSI